MASEPVTSDAETQEQTEQGQTGGASGQGDAAATEGDANGEGAGGTSGARRVLTTGAAAGAVAAAVGAAFVSARRALSSREDSGGGESGAGADREEGGGGASEIAAKAKEAVDRTRKRGEGLSPTIKAAGREIMKQNLIPVAETAAATAGSFAATSAPDFVRDRIVPKFIASFNEARGEK